MPACDGVGDELGDEQPHVAHARPGSSSPRIERTLARRPHRSADVAQAHPLSLTSNTLTRVCPQASLQTPRCRMPWETPAHASPAPRRLLGRAHAPAPGSRLRLLRQRRADRRARGAAPHPRARHPAGLEGRLDLPVPQRPPAGDGHRRRRPQAVPLPRRLAHAPRRREVRRHDRASPARCRSCASTSTPTSPTPASSTRERVLACAVRLLDRGFFRIGTEEYAVHERVLRPGDDAQGARPHRGRRRDGLRLPRQERQAAHPGGRRPAGAATSSRALKRRRGGGPELLAYKHGRRWRDLRSDDINDYLKEATGGDFSAKDFRTWSATVLAAVALAVSGEAPAPRPAASARSPARSRRSRTTSATRRRSAARPTSTRACSTPTRAG